MAYRRRFRTGFGRRRAAVAVTQSRTTLAKKRKCAGCGQMMSPGSLIIRLRLKKSFRLQPCTGCGSKLKGMRVYHEACVPADINKAMGYDPTQHAHAAPPASTVAPPPKPPSPEDAALSAVIALEQALILKLRNTPSAWVMRADPRDGKTKRMLTLEWEKSFATIQGLKSRAVRPGTPAEGETATSILLQRLVKLVYA